VPNSDTRIIEAIMLKLKPEVKVIIVVTVVVVTVEIMADNRALFRCHYAYKVYGWHHQEQKNIRQPMRQTNTNKASSFKH
jgi:hypothetical protein